ncbi:MAG: bifunctional (p)ppGpp synthetase/guanosine-3',5'-bis(diphosphate) 3'-pyrophosphohydrolase [Bacteroidales bacterium]|nr:bifunctional (p)ppGpp synthetase/guanosine-3',5'-bis(diphosphate) 3'-pyrophosphohydrolase [Bacteroidales bacterium]
MEGNGNLIQFDAQYKEELYSYFYNSLNNSFKTAEIEEQLRNAYDFAFEAHREQRRKTTGEPYIVHPVSVALIVANEIGLGVVSVVAALLHDVVEDTHYSLETITERFSSDVADIVAGLTKITNVYNAKSNAQSATFEKMLLSIPHDPRVVFIKLADRLHNMRTMEGMPQGTIQIKAGENLYVYVPIAYQLGLYDIKKELEDSSFRFAQPQQYASVVKEVTALRRIKDPVVTDFKKDLMRILVNTGTTCKITTEIKSYYYVSQNKNAGIPIEDISYEAVRIVFPESDGDSNEVTVGKHYSIYSAIICNFPERDGFRRDFVIKPKKNGFKALVFQVNYHGHWIEVQIITDDNDMVAHKGYSRVHPQRKGLLDLTTKINELSVGLPAEDLLARFHDLTMSEQRMIYVFTPKGDIQELPVDSTVLDFAYSVHTDVGNHCVGAYVGSKFVPLDYKLNTADKVTIFSSPSARPQQAWLHFVKTDRAKAKLNAYFHRTPTNDTTKSPIEIGKVIFNNYMYERNIIPDFILLKELIKHYQFYSTEEMYRQIANHELAMQDVEKVAVDLRKILRNDRHASKDKSITGQIGGGTTSIPPEISNKVPFTINRRVHFMAPSCCCPICGDDAVAFLDSDNVLYVHRRECVNAQSQLATDGKHTASVVWGDDLDPMITTVQILGRDRQGIIRDVSVLIDSWRINIQSFTISSHDNVFTGIIKMMVKDTASLEKLSQELNEISNIVSVNRLAPIQQK